MKVGEIFRSDFPNQNLTALPSIFCVELESVLLDLSSRSSPSVSIAGQYKIFIVPRTPRSGELFYFGRTRTLLYFVPPHLASLSGKKTPPWCFGCVLEIWGAKINCNLSAEEVLGPLAGLLLDLFQGEMRTMLASLSVSDPKERLNPKEIHNASDAHLLCFFPQFFTLLLCAESRQPEDHPNKPWLPGHL